MKAYKKVLVSIMAAFSLVSCNYLDFDESQGMTEDEAYSYFDNITRMVSAVYRSVPCDWGTVGGALRESATDNATYTWDSNPVYDMYTDAWSPINAVDDRWSEYYQVIYDANYLLENYSEDKLKRFEWSGDYADDIKKVREYIKEVQLLRAFYHFELAKRFGDVPLVLQTYDMNEINQVRKESFEKVIEFVDSECVRLAPELPVSQNEIFGETGHVTRGVALAIRARALLYAASPLFAGGDDSEKWRKAAEAAYDVMKLGVYSLPNIKEDPLYNSEGGNAVLDSKQLIWEVRGGEDNSFEAGNLPIGFEGATGGNVPTQNLVDDFDMVDGVPFDWNNPEHVANMFYDKNGNPTRDPRLYLNVICDGMRYMGTVVEPLQGGKNGLPIEGATITGYYLKKLMNETVSLDPVYPVRKPHHYPVYRYAEILLNYAEAMNEWKGPEGTSDYCPITALAALNEVRNAAGMPSYSNVDKDKLRTLIHKERRIELAFEDHRFWDIRRWKEGNKVEFIYGLSKDNSIYHKELVQTRRWNDKMYFYPIPAKETYVNDNLTQNPGW